jgi:hypothetical protein
MPTNSPSATGAIGNAVHEFLKHARDAERIATSAEVRRGKESSVLRMHFNSNWCSFSDGKGYGTYSSSGPTSPTPPEGLWLAMVNAWAGGTVDVSSIKVSATKPPLANKELKTLAIAAWCELFGVPVPDAGELKKAAASKRAAKQNLVQEWVDILKTGADGVAQWNKQQRVLHGKLKEWSNMELPETNLAGLTMVGFHCKGANFTKADLSDSHLDRSRFPQAKFTGATLENARLQGTGFESAGLEGANFTSAKLTGTSLKKANCKGANFAKADLTLADFCGADLTDADLSNANLANVSYDEETKWPKGFAPTLEMRWKGPGASPAAHHLAKARRSKKPLDLESFMKRLEGLTDQAKLDKALKMLKADRFKLYAQVTDDFLVGVVKSQNDPDLVYSCKLGADGVYGCCTQNLNVCGGLRGSLCKHLLVLIVGLANNGELDPNVIDGWVLLSQGQKPVLDKDAMSETFLRYKGAEAGEVDWRPTETLPEDYYAL